MLRIIDLDIEENITGDTGVFEVAFVEYPAIEQEMIYFSKDRIEHRFESYDDYPKQARENACKVLRWIDEHGRDEVSGMEQTGLQRANQLCKGEKISEETIGRMSGFQRHRENSKIDPKFEGTPWKDKGYVAWLAWGGTEGIEWASRKLEQIRKGDQEFIEPNPCQSGYVAYGTKIKNGREVPNCVPIEQSRQEFVYPKSGEEESDFIGRCMGDSQMTNEFPDQDQRTAVCYSYWERKDEFSRDNISFDWSVLETEYGRSLFENEMRRGSIPFIFVQGITPRDLIEFTNEYRIPASNIQNYTSRLQKIDLIKKMDLVRHYDDDFFVRKELGTRAVRFDYETGNLPPYTDYSPSGSTKLDLPTGSPSNQLMSSCGCPSHQKFEMLGYMDGQPVFSTPEEAEEYGEKELGCSGHHSHEDENGNIVYMSCDVHPTEMGTQLDLIVKDSEIQTIGGQENIEVEFGIDQYTKEEIEGLMLLGELRKTNYEEFERLVPQLVQGVTREELIGFNYRQPQKYYQYVRVDSGEPTRDFCDSIEGYYFRRFAIDAMKSYNLEFGHNRQPYSKWLYKGGPNCIHAWKEVEVKGSKITDKGMVSGTPGIPPKRLPNNGYYSEKTRAASRRAYAISQNMSSQVREEIFKKDDEKRMIFTPLMIPNILIPRFDEVTKERYYVRFKPEVIEKIRNKFMIEQRLRETNYEHTDKKFKDLVMVESWIVESDQDKVYSLGFTKEQIPFGTWMAGYKVLETDEGDQIWEELIKPGVVRGASVEGNFLLNFSRQDNDQYLLDKINQIINSII